MATANPTIDVKVNMTFENTVVNNIVPMKTVFRYNMFTRDWMNQKGVLWFERMTRPEGVKIETCNLGHLHDTKVEAEWELCEYFNQQDWYRLRENGFELTDYSYASYYDKEKGWSNAFLHKHAKDRKFKILVENVQVESAFKFMIFGIKNEICDIVLEDPADGRIIFTQKRFLR